MESFTIETTRFAKANLHGSLGSQPSILMKDTIGTVGDVIRDIEAFVENSEVSEEDKKSEEMKEAWSHTARNQKYFQRFSLQKTLKLSGLVKRNGPFPQKPLPTIFASLLVTKNLLAVPTILKFFLGQNFEIILGCMLCQFRSLQSLLKEQGAQEFTEANSRLRNARLFKHPADPTLEFYKFGHDEICSLLDLEGVAKIKLGGSRQVPAEPLSFYFGGSGYNRHVFGSLLDATESIQAIRKKEKNYVPPQLHMTLVDIHPAVVAKTLLIMELIHRLDQLEGDFNAQMSVQTTLAFLYVSLAMPDYCAQIVCAEDLRYFNIHLSPLAIFEQTQRGQVVAALLYWKTPLNKSTETLLKAHTRHKSQGQGLMLHGHMPMPGSPANFDPKTEDMIYDALSVQLPPKPFQSRHPALEKFIKSYKTMPTALVNVAKKEVYDTWKPNPTIFDETLFTLQTWNQRLEPELVLPLGANSFGIQAEFFRHVVEAIRYLYTESKVHIELVCSDAISGLGKLVAGDLDPRPDTFPKSFARMWLSNVPDYTNGILNMAVHILPYRNKLSDLNAVSTNCLLNTSVFASLNEFCYNYTLLDAEDLPRILGCQITSRSLNQAYTLKPLSMPCPLKTLTSKGRLHGWLSHLLVCTLISGLPQALPRRVDLPNNVHAFVALLAYLPTVGFPAHWISEFMATIVEDKLVTDALPYEGRLPIPSSYQRTRTKERKVCLSLWQAELESVVSQFWRALPFFVPMKRSSTSDLLEHTTFQDITKVRAKVAPIDFERHKNFREWMPLLSPFAPTMAIVFLSPRISVKIDELLPKLPLLLEGGGSDPWLKAIAKEA
ncbi:hypothetical protein CPB83DRAFT_893776 [Crepidotus variabilis]|uniref:DUF4470 domain-containing protein n=1 Tax=Crepidotus variabilis TaxID=179855 RepID=A0A9P6EHN0_9AGAR|nr:hypothetical protein CPB83DRAFT_893776 [Crepidotus variabilis]